MRIHAAVAAVLLAATGAPADPDGLLPPLNRSILEGARAWLARGSSYDASYFAIRYPGGDIPADRGACVDLVIRALRHAGLDLQRLIHEDRAARSGAYGTRRPPDTNLDHRRCVNQVVYLRRHARSLTTRTDGAHLREWLPGDLVYYGTKRAWHAGIVSDRKSKSGMPYIIDSHQEARGVSERFLLTHWGPILAHFRIEPPSAEKRRTRDRAAPPGGGGRGLHSAPAPVLRCPVAGGCDVENRADIREGHLTLHHRGP